MVTGHGGHEGFVVERRNRQIGVGKRLGQNRAVNLSGAQLFKQLDGKVFLQHQRHLRGVRNRLAHQIRQQVRAYRVDHTEVQGAGQWVLSAFGDLADAFGLLQHTLRLAYDFFTQRRHGDFVGIAFKQLDLQLFFQLLDGHTQCRLRHVAGLGTLAKMLFAGDGNDVFQFGKRHGLIVLLFNQG